MTWDDTSRTGILAIGCLDQQVAVDVVAADARAAFVARFAAVLQPLRSDPLANLALAHGVEGYVVNGRRAPRTDGSLDAALHSLRHVVTKCFLDAHSRFLWFHGAGVVRDDLTVLIVGPGGCGKSTLATRLATRGFHYLGDDALPLDPESGVLHPFPVTPSVRVAGPFVSPDYVSVIPRTQVGLDTGQVARYGAPIGLIVFPTFTPDAPATLRSCSSGYVSIQLIQSCLNFARHREHGVRAISRHAPAWPAATLEFSNADRAADLVVEALASARRAGALA